MRELAKPQVLTEGENQHLPPCYAATLSCLRRVTFFHQRKKVTKETPQGTDGSLTSFIRQELLYKTRQNVALTLRLTRSAAYLFRNVEGLLLSPFHYRHKASFEPLAQRVVFDIQKDRSDSASVFFMHISQFRKSFSFLLREG